MRRTDLAVEARALWQERGEELSTLSGVKVRESRREGVPVTRVEILDRAGEEALGKPRGTYITLELEGLSHRAEGIFARGVRAVAGELRELVSPLAPEGLVLVAGLGNRAITPDAVGPLVHGHTLVTRHLVSQMPERFGNLRPVASLAAEVLGSTGVESAEVVRAVCDRVRPACVIAVDALASRSLSRLCRTVQIADTGIVPGSGVGNHRMGLNRDSLGIPVIAVGVPTVVDGATLAADLTGQEVSGPEERFMVTPRDIDSQVADLGKLVGYGIDLALQPELGLEDLELLLS